MVKIA